MKMMCKMGNGNGRCKNDGKDCSHGEPHEPFVACDDPCERARLFNDKFVSPCQPYVIADPVQPAPDRVTCPACGGDARVFDHGVHKRVKCVACEMAGPISENDESALRTFTRIRIDPEPLVCPRCGGVVMCHVNGVTGRVHMECHECGQPGVECDTRAEAESEFRKLSYAGKP